MSNNKKMSLFKKLVVANFLYGIPVIALTWLMLNAKDLNIDFGVQELRGDVYQRPLEKILGGLTGERIMVQMGKKDERFSTLVNEGFADLEKAQAEVGTDLQFTDEGLAKRNRTPLKFETVKGKWDTYAAGKSQTVESLVSIIADIRGMITHAGDTSNLILDPDLDSYYLMDVTLLALPQSQDRIHEVLAVMTEALRSGKITDKQKVDFAVYGALLKLSDLDRVNGDFSTVLNEDPNFYGASPTLKTNLEPALKAYSDKLTKFIDAVNKVASGAPVSPAEFQKLGWEALVASFDSWEVAANELDILLHKRIDFLTKDKWVSLAAALLALLAAGAVLFWIANSFNKNMLRVLAQLKGALGQSRSSSAELVTLAGSLSQATSEQAAAVHETASALDEIRSMVATTLDNTRKANDSANQSFDSANQANTVVANMLNAVTRIADSNEKIMDRVKNSGKEMGEINQIISQIATRTKVINDIVFQTKLLSFNASVEAARAGEHGKGFSVVAEEVGNLAKMSGDASDEISKMLNGSITRVDSIVSETQSGVGTLVSEGNDRIRTGKQHAEETSEALSDIVSRSQEAKITFEHIMRASEEQSRGIDEITKALQSLNQITQQNTDMAERTVNHSQQLTTQSEGLESIVNMVEIEVLGKSTAA